MKRKILSVLMAVCFCLSLTTATVSAISVNNTERRGTKCTGKAPKAFSRHNVSPANMCISSEMSVNSMTVKEQMMANCGIKEKVEVMPQ